MFLFTGIIEEIGTVYKKEIREKGAILGISCKYILEDLKPGDSVATNGVCLTASEVTSNGFLADVMPDTLKSTNLGKLLIGSKVNLERALKANSRFGGHMVQGHVDGTGIICNIQKSNEFISYSITLDQELLNYIVLKGSVAVDGISLTVQELNSKSFTVATIPTTQSFTTLSEKQIGDTVNIETDIIGKYVNKFIQKNSTEITMEKLFSSGF